MEPYSVLMSVYAKEKPEHLKASIQSMKNQTVPFSEFVLVCDGRLPEDLKSTVFHEKDSRFVLVRLPENVGLANALNEGLPCCSNELIARMDSDDLSLPTRCEKELSVFASHSDLSIVSGSVTEFEEDPSKKGATRSLPEEDSEIREFCKHRNPFNHPCVMYRKSSVLSVGGYHDLPYLEDYELWFRMLNKGFKGYNLQESILLMRTGSGMYQRRGGREHFNSERKLFQEMVSADFITSSEYKKAMFERRLNYLLPTSLRKFIYQTLLRN